MPISLRVEETPNPSARRFIVDKKIQEEQKGRFFTSGDSEVEPMVAELLAIDAVDSVLLLPNSITLNTGGSADWAAIEGRARTVIEEHLS